MTNPSTPRARRIAGAVLLFAGLALGSALVVPGAPVAAAAPAPSAPAVVGLRKGAYGDGVKAVQLALVRVGVGVKYGVDSYFGSATEASVKAFQRLNGLPMTGVVDQATAAALGLTAVPAPAPAATPAAASTGLLGRGSTGSTVQRVQQALINFGFPIATGADGVFGAGTERALKAFQRANGLGVSGRTYPATMRVLGVTASAPAAAPPPAAAPATGATAVVGVRFGSRGPAVVQVQQALIKMGWTLRGGADGIFGPSTKRVLTHAQKSNGIPASGVVDAATARLLGLTGAPAAPPAAAPAGTGTTATGFAAYDERGPRVVALQKALIKAGITVRGGADGIFGSGTAGAVMAFQRVKGLKVSGKVDAATAAALGLRAAAAPAAPPQVNIRLEAKPVQGPCYYGDTWNAARGNGRFHLGVDIAAAEGNALYSVVRGKVIQIYTDRPGSLSGNGIKVARPDGTYFFYAHLSKLAPGMAVGKQVSAGQVIGYVGRTGNAGGPHLHFEIHPLGGSAINPYPIVKAFGAC